MISCINTIFTQIAFINPNLPDAQKLIDGITPNTEVIILEPTENGIEQITETLVSRDNITSIHIISHGKPASIEVGSIGLNFDNLNAYISQLQQWQKSLQLGADILLYGCNIAADLPEMGRKGGLAFLQQLSQFTGADIAASRDRTGSSSQGGNWNLEVAIGQIETPLIFQTEVMETYEYVLAQEAPVLNNLVSPSLTAINEDISDTNNTGTPLSTFINGLISDINNDPQGIAVTGVDNTNGKWQYSFDSGTNWTDFNQNISNTNATVLGWTSLYTGQLGIPPGNQNLTFVNLSGATQTLNGGSITLDSTVNPNIYTGYTTTFPTLDRNRGYSIRFDVKINSENHSFSTSDKNNDGLSDRAGFSVIAISSDGKKGVELAFWDNEIWVQRDGTGVADPVGSLFTHDPNSLSLDRVIGGSGYTSTMASYELSVFGDKFSLYRNGTPILRDRALRDYSAFTGSPDPYETPNFLFLGDNTTSASASFELQRVAVKTAEPKIRFVPNSDYYSVSNSEPSLTF
ncbi:MAG: DUF4347 domain-containing protein, partial [Microcoleaceae cyanobacterium]